MEKHTHEADSLEFANQKIVGRNMEREVKQSFIDYSMSVITARALPDIRDGMKPGQRRILYAMYEDHLTYNHPFRKSATTVGNVLGRYHPHGDAAVYMTMVRMAQPFSLRYPLIEGHGNFGNVDGDPPAAYRYTEARMARMADLMMGDIEKEVVPFVGNFDNTRREPTVLPSRFPNILLNGSIGIAVGMATNIPPHNLGEVVDGTIYRIRHPACTTVELMQFVKGPDFPTRGIVYGSAGIRQAYETGRGRLMVRARCRVEDEHHRIIVSEIPYAVNKSLLVEGIADLVKDKKVEGITDIRDESGRAGMRIVIEYRRDANGDVVLNQLYKYSMLQTTFAVNMLMLVGGEPKIMPLPAILDEYIKFQEGIIRRRTEFDLAKAQREMHIYEGYHIALGHIDEIIEIIKKSDSVADAKGKLMDAFDLSDAQAQAIVEMTLGRLSGLERQKIEDRLTKLEAQVAELTLILGDEGRLLDILVDELSEIKQKFGDERRTELVEAALDDIEDEDLIERHTCVLTVSHTGYIKRQRADVYTAQNRGGKGVIGMATKEEDYVEDVIVANSHSLLMMFTNFGRVYTKKAYRIPEAGRTAKGTNIANLLSLLDSEHLTAIIPIDKLVEEDYLTMVTRRGIIKRTSLSEFVYQRKSGKKAISLDEGDELLFVRHTNGKNELLIATRDGSAVRFAEEEARPMGRTARGVRGIRLRGDDRVIGVAAVEEGKDLLTLTERGIGKRTPFDDFRTMKNRGGHGVTCHNLSDKTGPLAAIAAVSGEDDIMIITDEGVIIRVPVAGIPVYSRTAGGVIVMRTSGDARIKTFARVERDEEIEQQAKEAADHLGDELPDEDEVEETGTAAAGADAPMEDEAGPAGDDDFDEGETDEEDRAQSET
ncbi:MAG: DNA gyrase subunit A [Clostridia bacterium]|nr:DNA gyrase subunit A [Clostridia bacterium]